MAYLYIKLDIDHDFVCKSMLTTQMWELFYLPKYQCLISVNKFISVSYCIRANAITIV